MPIKKHGGSTSIEFIQDNIGNILVDSASIDFTYNDVSNTITATVIAGGVDHGSLSGLSDDDHPQYALLAGRSGGQTLNGSQTSGQNLTLKPNSVAANGKILLGTTGAYDESNVAFGIGTQTPLAQWHLNAGTGDILINGGSIGSTASDGFKLTTNLLSGVVTFAQQENANVLFTRNAVDTLRFLSGSTVLNEGAANQDLRVEGVTEPNLLFVDASTNQIGIGTNTPSTKLHIAGNLSIGLIVHDTAGVISDVSSIETIDLVARNLFDNAGNISVDWSNRYLYDFTLSTSIDYGARVLYDYSSSPSIDYGNRTMQDDLANTSIDYFLRYLYDNAGVISTDYANRILQDVSGISAVDWQSRLLSDSMGVDSVVWETRQLRDINANPVLSYKEVASGAAGLHFSGIDQGTMTYALDDGAGTSGGPATVSIVGTDVAGEITITTKTGPAANTLIINIGFNTPYNVDPYITLTAANANACNHIARVFASADTSSLQLVSGSTALAADTQYSWFYHVIGKET